MNIYLLIGFKLTSFSSKINENIIFSPFFFYCRICVFEISQNFARVTKERSNITRNQSQDSKLTVRNEALFKYFSSRLSIISQESLSPEFAGILQGNEQLFESFSPLDDIPEISQISFHLDPL